MLIIVSGYPPDPFRDISQTIGSEIIFFFQKEIDYVSRNLSTTTTFGGFGTSIDVSSCIGFGSLLQNASQVGDKEMVALLSRLFRIRLEQLPPEEICFLSHESEDRGNQRVIEEIHRFFRARTFHDFITPDLERYFQHSFHPPSDQVLFPMFYPLLYDPSFFDIYDQGYFEKLETEVYLCILYFLGEEARLFLFLSSSLPFISSRGEIYISILFLVQEEGEPITFDEGSFTLYTRRPFSSDPTEFDVYNEREEQWGVLRYIPLRAPLLGGLFLPFLEKCPGEAQVIDYKERDLPPLKDYLYTFPEDYYENY